MQGPPGSMMDTTVYQSASQHPESCQGDERQGPGVPCPGDPTPSACHRDPGPLLLGAPPSPPGGEGRKGGMEPFLTEGTNLKLWENSQSHVNKCEITEHALCTKPTLLVKQTSRKKKGKSTEQPQNPQCIFGLPIWTELWSQLLGPGGLESHS